MKILTPEEEQEHYNATVKGGVVGGVSGLAIGSLGVLAATRRFPSFQGLTLPFRAFLIASAGTGASIITADHFARAYERDRHPENKYIDAQAELQQQLDSQKPFTTRAKDWTIEHRYPIVFGSWLASMGLAFGIVSRNPYLSGQQKLVQARVYAQGLTLAVLIASFAFETNDASKGKGRWETIKVLDPDDPTHQHVIEKRIHHERYAGEDQWRDVVAAEERRMKEREERRKQHAKEQGEEEHRDAPKKSEQKSEQKA